jgi:arylsulfate sulfotransferase
MRGIYIVFLILIITNLVSCKKSEPTNITNNNLPQNFYTVTVNNNPTKGEILVAPFTLASADSGRLMIFNQNGQLQWQKVLNSSAADFKKWQLNGLTRYTYFVHNLDAYVLGIQGSLSGYEVLIDENMNEIKEFNLLAYNDIKIDQHESLDGHDFIYLSDDHYISMAYYNQGTGHIPAYYSPSPNATIVVPIIQEVQNGNVIWQWDASTDTSFYGSALINHNYSDTTLPQDYMHMNSMTIDPRDNNLVCSFRSMCQVLKLQRGTGKVLWRLGGNNSDFNLRSSQVFLFQHDVSLVDSNMTYMMFDNGDPVTRPYSRILEFQLDETNKQVIGFKSFDLLEEPFSSIMGSVQKFGINYFIGGGIGDYVLEINALTGQKIFEMKSNYITYRAFKYPN